MFSISTIASSTRMPVTSVIASRLTRLSEKPMRVHHPEGRDDRQRQRQRGDDSRADVAQEHEHDDDGEQGALDQRLHRRVVVAEFVVDLGVDFGEGHFRVGGLRFWRASPATLLVDRHVAGALGAGDAEGDDRLIEQPGEGARFGRRRRSRVPSSSSRTLRPPDSAMGSAARSATLCAPAKRADRLLLARRLRRGRRRDRRCWRAPDR